jgi:hypothetical protein
MRAVDEAPMWDRLVHPLASVWTLLLDVITGI